MDWAEFFIGIITASVVINSGLLAILVTRAPWRRGEPKLQIASKAKGLAPGKGALASGRGRTLAR